MNLSNVNERARVVPYLLDPRSTILSIVGLGRQHVVAEGVVGPFKLQLPRRLIVFQGIPYQCAVATIGVTTLFTARASDCSAVGGEKADMTVALAYRRSIPNEIVIVQRQHIQIVKLAQFLGNAPCKVILTQ